MGDGAAEDIYQVVSPGERGATLGSCSCRISRLNAKVKPRDVLVNDLAKDLSDGVSSWPSFSPAYFPLLQKPSDGGDSIGYPDPPPRNPRKRISRPLCLETKAAGATV